MLSLSQAYVKASTADAAFLQALSPVARSAWKWAHYTHLLVVVSWMFLLCGVLYRFALVPRALAAMGMVTALLQMSGITLPQFVGYSVRFPALFGIPLGLSYVTLALWLITKEFKEPHRPFRVAVHGVEFTADQNPLQGQTSTSD